MKKRFLESFELLKSLHYSGAFNELNQLIKTLSVIQQNDMPLQTADQRSQIHLAEDKNAELLLNKLELAVSQTDHKIQLETAKILIKRFLKRPKTTEAGTNTVNSALDAIKIDLKNKDEDIEFLQKDTVIKSSTI